MLKTEQTTEMPTGQKERFLKSQDETKTQIKTLTIVVERNKEKLREKMEELNKILSQTKDKTKALNCYEAILRQKKLIKETIADIAMKWTETVDKLNKQVDSLAEGFCDEVNKTNAQSQKAINNIKFKIRAVKQNIETILDRVDLETLGDDIKVSEIIVKAEREISVTNKELETTELPKVIRKDFTLDNHAECLNAFDRLNVSVTETEISKEPEMDDSELNEVHRDKADLGYLFDKKLTTSRIFDCDTSPKFITTINGEIWTVYLKGWLSKHTEEGVKWLRVKSSNQQHYFEVVALAQTNNHHIVASCFLSDRRRTFGEELLLEIDSNARVKETIDENLYTELRSNGGRILALASPESKKLQSIRCFTRNSNQRWNLIAETNLKNYIYNGFCIFNGKCHITMGEFPWEIHVYDKHGVHTQSYGGMQKQNRNDPLRPQVLFSCSKYLIMADGNSILIRDKEGATKILPLYISRPVGATLNNSGYLCVASEGERKLLRIRKEKWWESEDFLTPLCLAMIGVVMAFVFYVYFLQVWRTINSRSDV